MGREKTDRSWSSRACFVVRPALRSSTCTTHPSTTTHILRHVPTSHGKVGPTALAATLWMTG